MSRFCSPIAVAFALLTLSGCTFRTYEQTMRDDCFSRGGYLYLESKHDGCIFKNPKAK